MGRSLGAVLVTGCSTGIGRATALRLGRHGHTVYATARRPETLEELRAVGCRTRALDVCDEATMRPVVAEIEAEHGAVGALVNNAGYGVEGAVEAVPIDEARAQFETNVLGPARLTQLVIPAMRARGRGRIVNVTSLGGRITIPGGGFYHASKHALEALSDALRFELRGQGIGVVVVEPGAVPTRWVEKAVDGIERLDAGGPYDEFHRAVAGRLDTMEQGALAAFAATPERVAKVIERALIATRPRTRYVVPGVARPLTWSRFLPGRAWDALMRRQFPPPR